MVPTNLLDLMSFLKIFIGFVGVGTAVSAAVALLKLPAVLSKGKVVIVPDSQSGNVALLFNLVLFGAFVVGKVFYPDFDFIGLDAKLNTYANYAVMFIGLIVQIASTTTTYQKVLKPAAKFLSYTDSKTFG